jgi:hypothetical protein
MADEKERTNAEYEYNTEDFEWRFQRSLKDHTDKLEALPDERRKGVEEGLRKKFAEHEQNFRDLDGHPDYFEELDSLFEKQDRETAQHVDRAHKAYLGLKGQQTNAEEKKEHAEKLRDDLRAKMPAAKEQDRDRER